MAKIDKVTRIIKQSTAKIAETPIVKNKTANSETVMQSLTAMTASSRAKISQTYADFKMGLSKEELINRTSKECFIEKKFLDVDAPEYLNLAIGDKKALKHLVKASAILEDVFLKQDNHLNIAFRNFLTKKAKSGDEEAQMMLKLFNGQKGIIGIDTESNVVTLIKGEKKAPGKNFYPLNLSEKEFHSIIRQMVLKGEIDEVKAILNQHSVVKRTGNKLVGIDYTQEYQKEFQAAASELEKAAKTSTNKDFNDFLHLQAKALRTNDPHIDALADKKWATLQDTPLEFTITRENYDDVLTGSISENKSLSALLKKHNITPFKKDSIGCRVGIVNKKGTEDLLDIKKYLPIMAKNMPFCDKYEQSISKTSNDIKQTMVDVNLVHESGQVGRFGGSLTIAENLPNNDKGSLKIGGGKRTVYHREIRSIYNDEALQKRIDAILDPELHQYYNTNAGHAYTIGHENAHSLGPKIESPMLGKKNTNIIEENKADIAAIEMLDVLVKAGKYTENEKKQIITTFVTTLFKKAPPNTDIAHRVKDVMQLKYLLEEGAINIDKNGVVHIKFEKVVPTARKMLEEIITVQMKNDFATGEEYVNKHFVWTDDIERTSTKLREVDKVLNGYIKAPLADKLLSGQI